MSCGREHCVPSLRRGWVCAWVGWCALLVPVVALACRYERDARPFGERLAAAPVAFIGVVKRVNAVNTVWTLEHALHGAAGHEAVTTNESPGTCTIAFSTGMRYLYAGASAPSPTLPLPPEKRDTATQIGRLHRQDDAALELPLPWQACNQDIQCVAIAQGCHFRTAVNVIHRNDALAQVRAKGLDAANADCKAGPPEALAEIREPLCVARRCGVWFLGD